MFGNIMIYVMFMKIDSHEYSPSIGDFDESISIWIVLVISLQGVPLHFFYQYVGVLVSDLIGL